LRKGKSGFGFTASPVSDGEKLYFCTEDGRVFVVAAEKNYRFIAENTLGATSCMASPALIDGVLDVRARDQLVALKSELKE
jgi:zona occludens toxin (predicted ATPase)